MTRIAAIGSQAVNCLLKGKFVFDTSLSIWHVGSYRPRLSDTRGSAFYRLKYLAFYIGRLKLCLRTIAVRLGNCELCLRALRAAASARDATGRAESRRDLFADRKARVVDRVPRTRGILVAVVVYRVGANRNSAEDGRRRIWISAKRIRAGFVALNKDGNRENRNPPSANEPEVTDGRSLASCGKLPRHNSSVV